MPLPASITLYQVLRAHLQLCNNWTYRKITVDDSRVRNFNTTTSCWSTKKKLKYHPDCSDWKFRKLKPMVWNDTNLSLAIGHVENLHIRLLSSSERRKGVEGSGDMNEPVVEWSAFWTIQHLNQHLGTPYHEGIPNLSNFLVQTSTHGLGRYVGSIGHLVSCHYA